MYISEEFVIKYMSKEAKPIRRKGKTKTKKEGGSSD
jgi:hypothetical protein